MDKKTIASGILLGLLFTLIYIIYKTQFQIPQVSIQDTSIKTYNLNTTKSANESTKMIASNDDANIELKKGFISEKINGETFDIQMQEIDKNVKIFQDSYDKKELQNAATEVRAIDVHRYYAPYRDSVADALETKADKIDNEYKNDIINWSNTMLVNFYDIMEACLIKAGTEYERPSETHITYRYYYFMPN